MKTQGTETKDGIRRAVIYARYSSDNQREESIEGQVREVTQFAERNDIVIVHHYIDRALSARTDHRPQFQQMILDSAKGEFDTVLVWKLDRFSRSRLDFLKYKAVLKKNGVRLMSATEANIEGAEGILLESVLQGLAEFYSVDLSEKIKRGLTENVIHGKCNGGRLTFGYRVGEDHRFHVYEPEAAIVRECYDLYVNKGMSAHAIAKLMRDRGVRRKSGKPISNAGMAHLLCNEKYIGRYTHGRRETMETIPPIVTKEMFEKARMTMEKNANAPRAKSVDNEFVLTASSSAGSAGSR